MSFISKTVRDQVIMGKFWSPLGTKDYSFYVLSTYWYMFVYLNHRDTEQDALKFVARPYP